MQAEELKSHRKKLEKAFNQALTESPPINAAIESIREVGYDVFLIVEATIGFNRREESSSTPKQPAVRLKLSSHDEKFLKSLKIATE